MGPPHPDITQNAREAIKDLCRRVERYQSDFKKYADKRRAVKIASESSIRIVNTGCARRGLTVALCATAAGIKLPALIVLKEPTGWIPPRALFALQISGIDSISAYGLCYFWFDGPNKLQHKKKLFPPFAKKEKKALEQRRFVDNIESVFRVYLCVSSRGHCMGSSLLFFHQYRRYYADYAAILSFVFAAALVPNFGMKPNLGSFQKTCK